MHGGWVLICGTPTCQYHRGVGAEFGATCIERARTTRELAAKWNRDEGHFFAVRSRTRRALLARIRYRRSRGMPPYGHHPREWRHLQFWAEVWR